MSAPARHWYNRTAPLIHLAARVVGMHRLRRRQTLITRHVRIPAGLGLRIVLVADFHADAHFMRASDAAHIVARINEIEDVDLVAMPGDFVGHDLDAVAACAQELSHLAAPAYASLGNHDHYVDARAITRLLSRSGVAVLTNNARELRAGTADEGAIWIGGLDSRRGRPDARAMLADVPAGARCIVLGHEPTLTNEHHELLHLAGHTHHGQIRLRPLDPFYLPQHSRPWFEGTHQPEPGRWIHTTGGVGSTTIPLRVGCPPEIVVLEV